MMSIKESNEKLTNYLLIPLALIQSRLFWFYSAIYYLICEQPSLVERPQPQYKEIRNRSFSAPELRTIPPKINRKPKPTLITIRHRPSIDDEIKGTTCPPVWWQKTRVKFGHTPVHGDPKLSSSDEEDDCSSPVTPVTPNFSINIQESVPMSRSSSYRSWSSLPISPKHSFTYQHTPLPKKQKKGFKKFIQKFNTVLNNKKQQQS